MSLLAILETIRASRDVQVHEIEKNVQSQVIAILAQARMEAHQIEEDSRETSSAPAVAERARILHRAKLDALHIVGDVREYLVDTAIAQTRECLASFRSNPAYPVILRKLAEETLAQLTITDDEVKPQLMADPRDRVILENILDDLNLDLCVSYELNCWGGLTAKSADGRVVVINTFESRLEYATAFLRGHLAALFEEEQSVMEDIVHG